LPAYKKKTNFSHREKEEIVQLQ